MIKKAILTTTLVLGLTFSVQGSVNIEKVLKVFPGAKVTSDTKISTDLYEVQIIEKNSILRKSHFYTNKNVDFISPTLVLVNSKHELDISPPNFNYKELDLNNHATFTTGTGDERNHFINITTLEGFNALQDIFNTNGFKNNVFINFSSEDVRFIKYALPIFHGATNEDRIKATKNILGLLKHVRAGKITEEKALQIVDDKITKIKDISSQETLNEMSDLMKKSLELQIIFAKNKVYEVIDSKKISRLSKLRTFPQEIAEFDFSEYGNDLSKALADATAYKIGSGSRKLFLFTDIDCPACNKLDDFIHERNLKPDIELSILYYPLQALHPNALDKTRYVLSLPVSDRESESSRIQGTDNSPIEARTALQELSNKKLNDINTTISISVTLGGLFDVSATPTVMELTGKKIIKIKNFGTILNTPSGEK